MRTLALFAVDHLVGLWITVCLVAFLTVIVVQTW